MNRNEFIKVCGTSCLGLLGGSVLLQSCGSVYTIQGILADKTTIKFNKSEFIQIKKNGDQITRRYLLVRNENLKFPVVIYNDGNDQYTAIWLECTHQHNEVNVQGDILSCPGHGSEFDRKGKVLQGPAKDPLRTFKVTTDTESLYLHLV